ncbi:uncharacterized protein LOC122069393 isoform X2 [Macadamia integrifolia]|uniref:uncharacterized protein LOC122069393 isoform X2 n=1 Tax=Macadamia integrifolia TaxID=60698 RepID=UPI001C4ECD32|nr:uncharacterized protein LOC122069393 isoform X2 [Macadamia integrifolia]
MVRKPSRSDEVLEAEDQSLKPSSPTAANRILLLPLRPPWKPKTFLTFTSSYPSTHNNLILTFLEMDHCLCKRSLLTNSVTRFEFVDPTTTRSRYQLTNSVTRFEQGMGELRRWM